MSRLLPADFCFLIQYTCPVAVVCKISVDSCGHSMNVLSYLQNPLAAQCLHCTWELLCCQFGVPPCPGCDALVVIIHSHYAPTYSSGVTSLFYTPCHSCCTYLFSPRRVLCQMLTIQMSSVHLVDLILCLIISIVRQTDPDFCMHDIIACMSSLFKDCVLLLKFRRVL